MEVRQEHKSKTYYYAPITDRVSQSDDRLRVHGETTDFEILNNIMP